MQAFLYEAGRLTTKTNYLIPVLARAFAGQTGCEAGTLPRVLAFTGSGGKTSLMGRLAWEARQDGKKVLIATTTHMARPNQYATLTDDAQAIIRQLQQRISHKELLMDKMPDKPVYKNLKKQNYATNIK